MIDCRIASSSTPSSSMSSAVRWAIGLSVFFCIDGHGVSFGRVRGLSGRCRRRRRRRRCRSGSGRRRRRGVGGGDLAGAQVADGALAQRQDAAEADAHPAAGRHQHAGRPRRRRGSAVAPSASTVVPLRSKVTVPPSPATTVRGPELLGEQRSRPRSVVVLARAASSRPAGPQAQVLRSAQVGHEVGEVGRRRGRRARRRTARPAGSAPASASARRSARKIESGSLGATWTTVMS